MRGSSLIFSIWVVAFPQIIMALRGFSVSFAGVVGRSIQTNGNALFSTAIPSSSALKTFALQYKYVENMLERRLPHREAHLVYANDFVRRNILIAGGALLPAVEGGLLILRADSAKVVEDFAKNDPYVKNGLVTTFKVEEWAVAVGKI